MFYSLFAMQNDNCQNVIWVYVGGFVKDGLYKSYLRTIWTEYPDMFQLWAPIFGHNTDQII